MTIETMIDQITAALEFDLNREGASYAIPTYWLAVHDATGLVCSTIEVTGNAATAPLHKVFSGDAAVEGAALISMVQHGAQCELLASVRVRHQDDSDILRATLAETVAGEVAIQAWMHAL